MYSEELILAISLSISILLNQPKQTQMKYYTETVKTMSM